MRRGGWLLAAALVLAGCAVAGQGVYHQVRRGDTLWAIARAYAVAPAQILRYNRVRDPELLQVGDRLFVPGATEPRRAVAAAGAAGGSAATAGPAAGAAAILPPITLRWPVTGRALGEYGRHGQIFNNGIDLAAAAGTPVLAAGAGEIVYNDDMQGLGRVVLLDHGRDYLTVYAHLAEAPLATGVQVAAGAVLGRVGSSGRVTSPQLHFEVRYQSEAYDPRRFLPRQME